MPEREVSPRLAFAASDTLMTEPLLINTRPLARRTPLAASLLLHGGLVFLLSMVNPPPGPVETSPPADHKRTVLLLHLQDFRRRPRAAGAPAAQAQANAGGGAGTGGSRAMLHFPASAPMQAANVPPLDATPLEEQPHRSFELPATLPKRIRKQTIIQIDVPPDVALKQEIPLPNILSWTPTEPVPVFRKQFVPPRVKEIPKVTQNLPPAPKIELPNRESSVSDLKIATAPVAEPPRLPAPPATTAPVRIPKPESISQPPQIALPDASAANATALIALSESPVRPDGMVLVPPANQIGASGPSGQGHREDGSSGGDQRGKEGGHASPGAGDSGQGSGTSGHDAGSAPGYQVLGGGGNASKGAGGGNGNGSGAGNLPVGAGSGSGGAGTSGADGAGNGGGNTSNLNTEGLTRITLPKDGKFGVVVLGSSQATPYPESAGVLSGKMVYTVYLAVGLHKKWILQYCLTKAAEKTVPRGSATPIDAPWPFLIFRPDNLTGSSDYVIVHGMIDTDGRFDKLAMVFPEQFEQEELLISSLKLWTFRPASRDRVPTAVEVLLIIPTES